MRRLESVFLKRSCSYMTGLQSKTPLLRQRGLGVKPLAMTYSRMA